MIKILATTSKKLYEYTYDVKMYYSKTVNIYFSDNDFEISKKLKDKINKYANKKKIHLILRKSGTEKAVRIFIYQPTSRKINNHISKVVRMIKNAR